METVAVFSEIILSPILSTIFDKLTIPELLNFARQEKVLDEIKEWKENLLMINTVLEDAEEKQMKNESVKIWLRDLRDLAYDVEDILDEFNTEALGRKLIAKRQASTSKVWTLFPSCCTSMSFGDVTLNVGMGSKLKEITTELQKIIEKKNSLGLSENVGGMSKRTTDQRPETTSLVDESLIFGRGGEKNSIVELLLGGEASNNEFTVIPIVGMGGLGKTTLAQLAYNDDRVGACFDLKAWVCVSEDFDNFKIAKTILQSVTSEPCHFESLSLLQEKLKEKLSGKKFLIVLDDVWNENDLLWEELCKPFRTGMPGCKLIVTTRKDGVVSTTGTISAIRLQGLSDEDCLSLLQKHALGEKLFDEFPNLKEIGEKIVKKCKGLPLAVKTLGGVLRNKRSCDEWEAVLKSEIWDLPKTKNYILPALKLSYHDLPSYLKRCFAYCSLFPKDYEFDKNELVLLWMAEGFLHQPKRNKPMEDLGCEYFNDLLSRSFFQLSSAHQSRYVMHDLINDLAQAVADEVCFRLEDEEESNQRDEISKKARHSSLLRRTYEISKRFEVFSDRKCLRTFLALSNNDRDCYLSNKVVHDFLSKHKRLRVLSLSYYRISELPNSLGDLKHLRYLNLSHSRIPLLPDSVSALYNLQTLILCGCSKLVELPAGIKNLIDLHYLDITETDSLQEMPPHMGNLKRLRLLPKFIVGQGDKLRIRELGEMSHLQGKLSIYGLDNVRDVRDARVANLKGKPGLDDLALQWSDEFHNLRNEQDEIQVLNSLRPHENLKKLKIAFYGGTDFPSWVGDPLFNNIIDITLSGCRNSRSLPSFGRLPLLKYLYIEGMDGVERVGPEFCGGGSPSIKPFPCLETLIFENMLGWKEWYYCSSVEDEAEVKFPCLCKLEIRNCPKLIGNLPSHLPTLVELNISLCPLLANSLERLPSLDKLELAECNEVVLRSVVDLTSLATIKLRRISALVSLCVRLMQKLVALEDLVIEDCSELIRLWQSEAELGNLACLRRLVIKNCPQLLSLAGDEEGLLPCNLGELELVDCGNLEQLPNGLHRLTCLRSLRIQQCPKLVSFPETGWPDTLTDVTIWDCEALECLPDSMMMEGNSSNQSLLEELEINKCSCLKCFPRGKLPTTLKKLDIRNCENLESLPEGMMHDDKDGNKTCHLENLTISGCSSFRSFPTDEFPATLKCLVIWNCTQLESLSERMLQNHKSLEEIIIGYCKNIRSLPLEWLHSLTYLRRLYIRGCPTLESFPERGISIPNLKSFEIWNCENLKSLPSQMHNLTSLERLSILSCPGIVSFPEGGLPSNLTSLSIENCENLKHPMTEWALNTLTSLTTFRINGPCPAADMVSFPDEDCRILPTTLTNLYIGHFENLESLSRGLQNLTSLRCLNISSCPKIRSLPREGLPASLERLCISNCPLIEQRCLKERGDYYPSIAHIPFIRMTWKEL